jgi:hypothetical protein
MKGATHLAIHLANNHPAERSLNWIPGSASHLTWNNRAHRLLWLSRAIFGGQQSTGLRQFPGDSERCYSTHGDFRDLLVEFT